MHAVVVRSTLNTFDEATNNLREVVIPRLKQTPGFVAAQWVRLDETTGTSMVTFETAEAAQGFAEMLKTHPPAGATVNSVEVGEVVERA